MCGVSRGGALYIWNALTHSLVKSLKHNEAEGAVSCATVKENNEVTSISWVVK